MRRVLPRGVRAGPVNVGTLVDWLCVCGACSQCVGLEVFERVWYWEEAGGLALHVQGLQRVLLRGFSAVALTCPPVRVQQPGAPVCVSGLFPFVDRTTVASDS